MAWMNRASGNATRMNPARGQPVNLCTNTGLAWAWPRATKNEQNRSTAQGMAWAASRSRYGWVTMIDTLRVRAR
jgi:hypothetical protein